MSILSVTLEPKCSILSAPPFLITYSCKRPSRIAFKNENTPMKLDFPEPLAPITKLIAPSFKSSMEAMLLKPFILIESSS